MAGDERTSIDENKATVRSFFQLLEDKDVDRWIGLWARDGEQFYPFGTEMFPPKISGRDTIYKRWKSRLDSFESLSFPLGELWGDGDTVLARYESDNVLSGGKHYRNKYLGLFKFTSTGEIREYWEYFDPIVAGTVYGLAEVTYRKPAAKTDRAPVSARIAELTGAARCRHERVTFDGPYGTLVGDLYLPPAGLDMAQGPAVVVAGSWTTVKEQMAGRYAAGLAERGVTALAFDFTGYGQSEGLPRDWENPERKIADIHSAVDYLRSRADLDAERIGALGICAGSGYVAVAATDDPHLRSIAFVAPWLHDAALVNELYGGADEVARRVAAGQQARTKFEAGAEVDYVPAVSTEDPAAAMYGPFSYYLDAERGAIDEWGNRFAVMAWPDWLGFDPIAVAPKIAAPTLLVHSEQAAIPDGARRFRDALTVPKQFVWLTGDQFDFYDADEIVNPALDAVSEHYAKTL